MPATGEGHQPNDANSTRLCKRDSKSSRTPRLTRKGETSEIAQWVETLAAMPEDLSSVSPVEENQVLQVVP